MEPLQKGELEFKTGRGLTIRYKKFDGLEQVNILNELKEYCVPIFELEGFEWKKENMFMLIGQALKVDKMFIDKAIQVFMNSTTKPITIIDVDGETILDYLHLDEAGDYFQILWEMIKINFTKSLLVLGWDLQANPENENKNETAETDTHAQGI